MAKRVLVCAAWPYVHAVSHLGNVICMLSADVIARFYRQLGYEVEMVSGSDQHGAQMEFEAKKLGITPKELVDRNHKIVSDVILNKLNFSFTNYSYTTHPTHIKFVQDFYKVLWDKGFIIVKDETLPYCEGCKKFLPDRFVVGKCPHCENDKALGNQCDECGRILDPTDLIDPKCSECGAKPIFKDTKTGYFDLPRLVPDLKKYVQSKEPEWQSRVVHFTERWFEEGLNQRPITRDLSWGIPAPFPGLQDKCIYVWAEAVLGYLSTVVQRGKFKEFWQEPIEKSYFCLGKDNIPFHTIILPSLLLAHGDLNVPDIIVSNEYLGFGGKQFSKTRGIGVWLNEIVDTVPSYDIWRYYLYRIYPENKDTDFSWKDFAEKVNTELVANFSNFVNRVINLLNKYYDGKVPEYEAVLADDKELLLKIKRCKEKVEQLIKLGKIREPLDEIMLLSKAGNEYLQSKEPWKNEDNRPTLRVCAQLLKVLSVLLHPYLPEATEKLQKLLNVDDLSWENIDDVPEKVEEPEHLFDNIDVEVVQKKVEENRQKTGAKPLEEEKEKEKDETLFKKFDLRVAKVLEVKDHPKADKLFVMQIDLGELGKRQIVAGMKGHYSPEELIGKNIIVIANLKPAVLRGEESNGMLLAGVEESNGKNAGLVVAPNSAPGDKVSLKGKSQSPETEMTIDQFAKLKMSVKDGKVMFDGNALATEKEDLSVEKVGDGARIQ
ncbi:methionine--tRNA ligase [Candidatus Woesearchaeota archaeon]|nr:methionine--tRNA ligase [Candidatus Woesearchaeota archaeon]